MPHNEELTQRVRKALASQTAVEEKKMFRGTAFMVNGKLCLSTGNDELMLRFDPVLQEDVLQKQGTRLMVMKEKELKGYVYVHEDVLKSEKEFAYWIGLALDFNAKAKASKKKAR